MVEAHEAGVIHVSVVNIIQKLPVAVLVAHH